MDEIIDTAEREGECQKLEMSFIFSYAFEYLTFRVFYDHPNGIYQVRQNDRNPMNEENRELILIFCDRCQHRLDDKCTNLWLFDIV